MKAFESEYARLKFSSKSEAANFFATYFYYLQGI
jgi:hypothetical protein